MPSLNKVFVIGNITKEIELRHTSSGKAVTELSIAINEAYKAENGEYKETVTYVNLTVWGRQAESCAEYLKKGSPVFAEAKLQLDKWEGDDGKPRSTLKLRAERIQFLSRPEGESRRSSNYRTASENSDAMKKKESTTTPPPDDDEVPF